jgi:hypothetical protein
VSAIPAKPPTVMATSDLRKELPRIAARCRAEGAEAGIVYFGAYRHADAAIVPAALLDALIPYLEDIAIASRVRDRLATASVELGLAELDVRLGFDKASVEQAQADMAAKLNIA